MGEGWSDWYALDLLVGDGLMADTAARGRRRPRALRRRSPAPGALPGHRLPGRGHGGLPGQRARRRRRLHVRRLRPRRRRRRRPRRRRDLGRDAVGPARGGRPRRRAGADHRGHADGAARAVVPRHAQRDPGRRGGPSPAITATRSGRCSPRAGWATWRTRTTPATSPRPQDFSLPPAPGGPRGRHDRHRDLGSRAASPLGNVTVGLASLIGRGGVPGRARDPDRGERQLRARRAGRHLRRAGGRAPGLRPRARYRGFPWSAAPVSRTSRCVATGLRERRGGVS